MVFHQKVASREAGSESAFLSISLVCWYLSLRSKLRKTCMYERESGTYSPTFCFRNTSAGSTYRFLPFVKHIQVTLHLFSLRFFFSVFYDEIFDDFDFQGLFT